MPTKRAILAHFKVQELRDATDRYELEVDDRRVHDQLVDAVARSKKARIADLLGVMKRDRLKELCRALGLSDGGRANAGIIDRLLGNESTPRANKPKAGARATTKPRTKRAKPKSKSAQLTLPIAPDRPANGDTPALGPHLWEAANILRGSPVDRTDWKSYILPLLFFKRICDVWDEEHADILSRYGEHFADEHRFVLPADCHWRTVRARASNIGTALAGAMRGIEAANPKNLHGIFGDAPWTNKQRLPDDLLKDLIEHFSALPLGNQAADGDVMGDAYEYLIKKFADSTNKKAGEFYTPRSVVRLMADILDPQEGETVYDPACGTGGMLLAAVEHVRDRGGDPRTFFGKLYGQEKNLTTSSVARMNLLLHGVEDFQIERGDTLRRPVFTDATGGLQRFDVVIANPPFSLKNWGREVWESDPWGRAFAGLPTDKSGDFAWVQHMVSSMADRHGRMAVVLPQGALFRGGVEGQIRQHLLEHDRIEAVIGLAPNLFYGTGLAACIIVLRMHKPKKRRKQVLIVDASALFRKDRAQNHLEAEHAAEILSWVCGFQDVEDRARVVGLDEIEKEGFTLNISRYVLPPIGKDIPPLDQAVADFKAALARCRQAEEALRRELVDGGWLA